MGKASDLHIRVRRGLVKGNVPHPAARGSALSLISDGWWSVGG